MADAWDEWGDDIVVTPPDGAASGAYGQLWQYVAEAEGSLTAVADRMGTTAKAVANALYDNSPLPIAKRMEQELEENYAKAKARLDTGKQQASDWWNKLLKAPQNLALAGLSAAAILFLVVKVSSSKRKR